MTRKRTKIAVGVMKRIDECFKKLNISRIREIASTALVFFGILMLWIVFFQYFTADKYQAVVRIGDESPAKAVIGADVIDYGTLAKGGSATGFITVENRGNRKIYIRTIVAGNIRSILKIDRNNLVLLPRERSDIKLLLDIPINTENAQYKGKVIIFKVPAVF